MPCAQELAALYGKLGESYFLDPVKLAADFWERRYDPELKLLSDLLPLRGRSLDIGCATGAFLKRLRDEGHEGEGIEMASASVEWARKHHGFRVTCGDVLSMAFPDHSFNLLTAWATLEHLEEPIPFLQKCRRMLVPEGWLALSIPHVGSLSHRLLGAACRMVHPCHLLYFHGRSLERLLHRSGFEIVRKMTTRFNPYVFIRDFFGLRDDETRQAVQAAGRIHTLKRSSGFAPLRAMYRILLKVLESRNLAEEQLVLARSRQGV